MNAMPMLRGPWLGAFRLALGIAFLCAIAAVVADQLHGPAPARLVHAVLLGAAAAFLHRRRPADPVAAMLSLAFLLWALTRSLSWLPAGQGGIAVALLDKLRFALFVAGMLLFPTGRFEPRWTLHAMVGTWAVGLLGVAAALGLASPTLYTWLTTACAAAAVAALLARFRALPPGVQRQQIKWAALGLGLGLALVAASRLIALVQPGMAAPFLFDAGVIVIALGILAALSRYRLYDADAAISRSTAFAGLTVALLATFAASEAVLQAISQNWLGMNAGAVSGAIAAAFAAGLTAPLHARVSAWAEKRFQKGLVALQHELPSALADLCETVGLNRLAETVLLHVEAAVRSSSGALLLNGRIVAARHAARAEIDIWAKAWSPGDETALDCDGEDPLFPCRVPLRLEGAGLIGWLLVGRRPDGSPQGADEREALAASAGAIARALWVAARREKEARPGKFCMRG